MNVINKKYKFLLLEFIYIFYFCYDICLQNHGGKKRKRSNEREVEKPGEVVHVRARRGQATDSHSLAERVIHL